MKCCVNILSQITLVLAILLPGVASSTITMTYQGVPSSTVVLKADDTFTVDALLRNDGSIVRAGSFKFEIEPIELAYVTNIEILGSPSKSYSDATNSRAFLYFGTTGNNSSSLSLARITFRVSECPPFETGVIKINPLSIAVGNGASVTEKEDIVEEHFTLNFEKKECIVTPSPTPTKAPGVGGGSYETTEFDADRSTSSTGIASCGRIEGGSQHAEGALMILILVSGLLVIIRQRRVFLVTLFVLTFGISVNSFARIYHVDQSGCSGETCRGDQNHPFVSLEEAFIGRHFEPGDEILIHEGTYNESVQLFTDDNGNGLLGLPIRIRGEGNAIIDGGGDPGLVFKFLISYWSVEDLHFRNGGSVEVAAGVQSTPASLLFYLVGQQMNVVNNRFSGTVGGGRGKSAMTLLGSTGFRPNSHYNGHLIKGNTVDGMSLSGTGSAGMTLGNFDFSYAQNNLIRHTNASTAPQAALKVTGGSYSVIERNALMNRTSPSSSGVGGLILRSTGGFAVRNNIIVASSTAGSTSELDAFMGTILMLGSGSLSQINRVHHNSLVHMTDSPGASDNRRTAIMVHDYGNSRTYSDWVNNIMSSVSSTTHPHFLWTGAYTTNSGPSDNKRVFIDYNSVSDQFYPDSSYWNGVLELAPIGMDRMGSNSLHDQINLQTDYSNGICAELNNSSSLPICKHRDYVAYAGSPTGGSYYNLLVPFNYRTPLTGYPTTTQSFTDHNQPHTGTYFSSAAADPYNPNQYSATMPSVGATGQNRCSTFLGDTNGSCDGTSGHLGGAAQVRYGSQTTVSICSGTPNQLDIYPSADQPDRRLTATDFVLLQETKSGSLADKVGRYLVNLNVNELSCD
jgi:hypothetical protein